MTAVEWFWIHLPEKISKEYFDLFEEAKEMEKQQIIDAANLQSSDYRGMPTYNKSGEQYYNETFKNK
jgi:hypothetical protein